jgi:small subunit ribosomal protein S20
LTPQAALTISGAPPDADAPGSSANTDDAGSGIDAELDPTMANTKSAKKAARKIARRTVVNKSRRSRVRNYVRRVEEAIAAGDRNRALAMMREAEPQIMRAAQKGVLHRNNASRKVSRLVARIAKLGA